MGGGDRSPVGFRRVGPGEVEVVAVPPGFAAADADRTAPGAALSIRAVTAAESARLPAASSATTVSGWEPSGASAVLTSIEPGPLGQGMRCE